jgi:carboxymethylenebutenolidase
MTRKTASDFHPEVLKLFDRYVHGGIQRGEFLRAAARYAVAGVTAEALLSALSPRYAEAAQTQESDPRITVSRVDVASPNGSGTIRAYLVRPAKTGAKTPVVLVVHENRGLNPHIEDIARRLAVDGFIALAPDALSPLGGYPGDDQKALAMFGRLDPAKTRNDFLAAAAYLKALPDGNGKVGVVGFCWGGGIANFLATRIPDLAAAVPFYGAQPSADEAARIKAPLLIHYAGNDTGTNAGWPAYEAALKAAHVRYQEYTYPNVEHGFNNDTTPRYDAAAAKLAWDRTIAFFKENLRS